MKIIPLTKNQVTIVDDKNYQLLNKVTWQATKGKNTYYATRVCRCPLVKQTRTLRMNRVIMAVTSNRIMIDHKDRNGLNNLESNLRICTPFENNQNSHAHYCSGKTSQFKGVHREIHCYKGKVYKYWRAEITCHHKKYYLGSFQTEIEAAKAYDIAARKYHGKFAYLNIPNIDARKAGIIT